MLATPSGFLNIDKPSGMTSFDVVRAIRRAAGVKRVGHAGTLDPLATGVLPVAIGGDATRLIDALVDARKAYTTELTLGIETDTDDAEGESVALASEGKLDRLTDEAIQLALAQFVGEHAQLPPQYSAIKRAGVPAYRAARRGETVDLMPRVVTAHALRLVSRDGAQCCVEIECSKGYYVRALARDLGRALGVGAHVSALRRTQVGPFGAARAVPLAAAVARLEAHDRLDALLHAPDAVLTGWPAVLLDAVEVAEVRFGRPVAPPLCADAPPEGTRARAYDFGGSLVALTEYRGGRWQPVRVLVTTTDEQLSSSEREA